MIRQAQPDGFERCVQFTPAYDHRADGRGQHVVDIFFTLIGPDGAVTLRIFSGWDYNLPDRHYPETFGFDADDAGLFYCSRTEMPDDPEGYYGHTLVPCVYLGQCYSYGASSSGGKSAFTLLIREGEEPFWAKMREHYNEQIAARAAKPLDTPPLDDENSGDGCS